MTQYVLEVIVDGKTQSVMLEAMPTTLKLRLLEHSAPVVTVVAEKVVL